MGYAVELYFDPETEMRVTELWETLSAQGIRSVFPDLHSRPHISLAVFDDVEPTVIKDEVRGFAREHGPIHLELSAVGIFPTSDGVVFIVPTVTKQLLAAHGNFHERVNRIGLKAQGYYWPGRWVPHCTIASELPTKKIAKALDVSRNSAVFGPARLITVGLISFRPVHELYTFRLEAKRVRGAGNRSRRPSR